ncbi:phage holin family protein [Streptomyces spectabilis]|uniref:phage holin family protein n=1 Tax=Streptomyces spectabilis TaxID=68270 RepID=UPI0033C3F699
MTASDNPHHPQVPPSSAPGRTATGVASPETALSDALSQVVHEAVRASLHESVRAELRGQVRAELADAARKQRRKASLYATAGAVALYAGAAAALTLGLAIAAGLPAWAAGLIVTVLLAVAAVVLRNAARPTRPGPAKDGTPTSKGATSEGAAEAAVPQAPRGAPGTADFPAVPATPPGVTAPPATSESPSPRAR